MQHGKKELTFLELPAITMAMNKLYTVSNIPGLTKFKILKMIKKLKEDENIYNRVKEEIIDIVVDRDENGNRKTKIQKINGMDIEMYDIKDKELYNEKMGPLLKTKIEFDSECLNIPVLNVCNSPLTVQDIEFLIDYGILKEDEKDARGKKAKIITTKN